MCVDSRSDNSHVQLEMLLKYPLVTQVDQKATKFKGYLTIEEKDYLVDVTRSESSFVVLLPELEVLQRDISVVTSNKHFSSVIECLDFVRTFLREQFNNGQAVNNTDVYRLVLNEFNETCEFHINLEKCSISSDLQEIMIVSSDFSSRKHNLVIGVDYLKTNDLFFVKSHSLPEVPYVKENLKPSPSLRSLCDKFLRLVESLQPFFDVMDKIDATCWILDPEMPSRKDVHRRIAIGDNISVVATFDPFGIGQVPVLKFLGPGRLVEQFRLNMVENLGKWNATGEIVSELLVLIGAESLPEKPTNTDDAGLLVTSGECCICFSFRLDGKLPDVVCSNRSCEVVFHTLCLYQWFISLNCQRNFNEIIGNCPNCEKKVPCPIP